MHHLPSQKLFTIILSIFLVLTKLLKQWIRKRNITIFSLIQTVYKKKGMRGLNLNKLKINNIYHMFLNIYLFFKETGIQNTIEKSRELLWFWLENLTKMMYSKTQSVSDRPSVFKREREKTLYRVIAGINANLPPMVVRFLETFHSQLQQ